jgi:hypothetical protein
MPFGEERNMEKDTSVMKREKRTFNYIILALLVAAIAAWIVWYPK